MCCVICRYYEKERGRIHGQTRVSVSPYRLLDVQKMEQVLTGTVVWNLYLEKEKLFKVLNQLVIIICCYSASRNIRPFHSLAMVGAFLCAGIERLTISKD